MSMQYRDEITKDPKAKKDVILKRMSPNFDAFRKSADKKVVEQECRTKQSFKDSCDINKMLKTAQVTGSISHLMKYPEAIYGEFDGDVDLLTARTRIDKAQKIFDELPSEIRSEFQNDALKFVRFAGDPANNERLATLLPAIAEPGKYFPNPVQRGGVGAGAATAPEKPGSEEAPANPPAVPQGAAEVPQSGTDGG